MANDNTTKIGPGNPIYDQLNTPSTATTPAKRKPGEIGKDEFLQLLVTQLKNQDPMDPMKNDQFAVDMAQFAQVEQLIGINDKLTKSGESDVGSLVSYLGREVTVKDDAVQVQSGNGGRLRFNLDSSVSGGTVELLGPTGGVVATKPIGQMAAGSHSIALTDLGIPDGSYKFRVKGIPTAGGSIDIAARVSGIVSGFVPGPEPKLLIGAREIKPADILEVSMPSES